MYIKSKTTILRENVLLSIRLKGSTANLKCILECMYHNRTHELVVVQDGKGETPTL